MSESILGHFLQERESEKEEKRERERERSGLLGFSLGVVWWCVLYSGTLLPM